MSNFIDKIFSFFRINFIGRPYELNKLVFDNNSILNNREEAKKIIEAYRVFKGWQYLGNSFTFFGIYASYKISLKFGYKRKTQIILIGVAFMPLALAHLFSYFTYWNLVRDIVIFSRERNKKYSHLKGAEIEEFQIIFNTSKDFHRFIQSNIGVKDCLFQIFRNKSPNH
jgi:hypothetical protein